MLIQEILEVQPLWTVAILLILGFALLYFSLAGFLFLFFNWTLKKGITQKVINKPYFENQIKFEMVHSIGSIVVFGLYGLLIVACYRAGIVDIEFSNSPGLILFHLFILAIWNEVHFYLGHKLMHTKLFLPVHRTHHKSIVVTPFSTYSFNPIESVIFGTVMILPMLVYNFEVWALIIFPVYHLFFNILGHSNVQLIANPLSLKSLKISTRHNDHHTKFHINFGFVSKFMDLFLKTNKLKKGQKKN